MSGFDGIKALREEISGLVDVRLVMLKRERNLAAQYGEVEVELNNVTKLRGFADAELDRKRRVLLDLESQG